VGGILAETEPSSGQVVLGIGINVRGETVQAVNEGDLARGTLEDQIVGELVPEQIIALLVGGLYETWAAYRTKGFPLFRDRWEARAWRKGEYVRLHGEGFTCSGVLAGLDQWGRLVVMTPEGRRAYSSGSLSLRW
jgi:biotin-(acetyl-CoA carboxylase) ligase